VATIPGSPDAVPRGIEILVKKASVDPDFRALLLEKRAEAAREIGLELEPAEVLVLSSVPAPQLEAIIAGTVVSPMTRAAFLGRAAAAMIAALGTGLTAAGGEASRGVQPDRLQGQVVYEETDYKGDVTCGLMAAVSWGAKVAEVTRNNRAMGRACELAGKAWRDDPNRGNAPFPMDAPHPARCARVGAYSDREAAQAALQQKQDELAKRMDQERKRGEERLATLSETERDKEQKRAELLRAARQLFEEKLRALLAEPAPGPVPMAPTGSRPDRP
jgi:hypothetical protein